MARTTAFFAALLTGVLMMAPAEAGPPEKFFEACVEALEDSKPKQPRAERENFCQCVTDGGKRLGFSRREFAVERERLDKDTSFTASGRLRQVSARCDEDLQRGRTARSGIR